MSQMRNRQKKEYGKYIHLNEKIWDICDEMATPKQREAFDPKQRRTFPFMFLPILDGCVMLAKRGDAGCQSSLLYYQTA